MDNNLVSLGMANAGDLVPSTRRIVRRRRAIASCIPCYYKKQKCDRQFPCNHCNRRRRPELCTYTSRFSPAQHDPEPNTPESQKASADVGDDAVPVGVAATRLSLAERRTSGSDNATTASSLSDAFGYFGGSTSNTMGYIRQSNWHVQIESFTPDHIHFGYEDAQPPAKSEPTSHRLACADDLQSHLAKMPARGIMDFLTQHFFKDVNWIHQFLYAPGYLTQYELWWNRKGDFHVEDVQFALLMLQICAYASRFLPSKEYTSDTIRGQSLSDIRSQCTSVANLLKDSCGALLHKTTLTRIQYLCLEAMSHEQEGRFDLSRSVLAQVIQEFQAAGMHREPTDPETCGLDELEQEMRRRLFCNLYVWDRRYFSSLDHDPLLAETPITISFPKMHLTADQGNASFWTPDPFTVRVLQAQLARFWFPRTTETTVNNYDIDTAEEWYERFSKDFLPHIPSQFALVPEREWDERVPDLPRQRMLFHISLYESICYNFRQLLKVEHDQIRNLARYKLALLAQHRRYLMEATVGLLECVSALHSMLGSQQTRFPLIPFHYFEGSLYLGLCLQMEMTFGGLGSVADGKDAGAQVSGFGSARSRWFDLHGPLRESVDISEPHCLRMIEMALSSLETMASCSTAAETAAGVIRNIMFSLLDARGKGGGHLSPRSATSSSQQTPQHNPTSDYSYVPEHSWDFMNLDSATGTVTGASTLPTTTDLSAAGSMRVSHQHSLEAGEHPEVELLLSSFIPNKPSMDDWTEFTTAWNGLEES